MAWHARLAASTASRWMNCTGSVVLIDQLPNGGVSSSSPYAAEGTAAHHVGAECLIHGKGTAYDFLGRKILIFDGDAYWPEEVGDLAKREPEYTFEVTTEMAEAVDVYLRTVDALREEFPGAEEAVETTMDMSWLDERFGGTADYMCAEFMGLLSVVDYKHGSGVVVEVKDNYQLKKYGVGALHYHPDCDRVRVYIVQPRAPHPDGSVRSVEYTRAELDEFSDRMVAAAKESEGEDASLAAGDWCRWCPAAASCPEMREEVMRQAAMDFDDEPGEETRLAIPDDLGRILQWAPIFETWFRECDALAQRALESGLEVEGQKLVHKKVYRHWIEEDNGKIAAKVIRVAKGLGHVLRTKDMYSEPKVLSPSAAEKLGKGMKKAIKDLWDKPEPSSVTMAPASDPRDAVKPSAVTDFEDDI